MKAAAVILLMFAGVSAGAEPRYTVTNKCPPAFQVTNKMPTTSGVVVAPRFTDTTWGTPARRVGSPARPVAAPGLSGVMYPVGMFTNARRVMLSGGTANCPTFR